MNELTAAVAPFGLNLRELISQSIIAARFGSHAARVIISASIPVTVARLSSMGFVNRCHVVNVRELRDDQPGNRIGAAR